MFFENPLDPSITLNIPSPTLFMPLSANTFPNKLEPNVSNKILKNPPICYFASFWIVWLAPFNNEPKSSKDFTTSIKSSISSFDIINVANPNFKIFLCIPASAADANGNFDGIKTLLVEVHFSLMIILFLVMSEEVY